MIRRRVLCIPAGQTTKRRFVMDTRTDERRAYVEELLNRLRRLYVERVQMPGDGKSFSFELLQRLCYYITSEGYGE
jgi:hypothetical protein